MKRLKGIVLGNLTAIGGLLFTGVFAAYFDGIPFESAVVAGLVVYLIIVAVTCTYLLYQKGK